MDATKGLTDFLQGLDSLADLSALLDAAGLELWQSPEGFWAIRLKKPHQVGRPEKHAYERAI